MQIEAMGLAIGLPTRGKKVAFEWGISFSMQNYPVNVNRSLFVVRNKPIDEARNLVIENALKIKAKYVWFLDDDVACPNFSVRRLMYDLEQADDDVAVAMGIYPGKSNPPVPMIFQKDGEGAFWKWKHGDVFDVASGGTGCMLIRTEIFKTLPKPWFKTTDNMPHGNIGKEFETDDIYFCRNVREAGYKLIADGNVICTHFDYSTDPPTMYSLPQDSYPFKKDEPSDHSHEPVSLSAAG